MKILLVEPGKRPVLKETDGYMLQIQAVQRLR